MSTLTKTWQLTYRIRREEHLARSQRHGVVAVDALQLDPEFAVVGLGYQTGHDKHVAEMDLSVMRKVPHMICRTS